VHSNCIVTIALLIFDRWGEKIFESDDITKGWDGTFRGKKLQTGVFVYLLEAETIQNKTILRKGNITLIK